VSGEGGGCGLGRGGGEGVGGGGGRGRHLLPGRVELRAARPGPRAVGRLRGPRRRLHFGAVSVAATAVAALLLAVPAPAPGVFAECERAVAGAPDRYESYLCYYRAGARGAALPQAAERLGRVSAEGRGGGWPLLGAAHVASARDEPLDATSDMYGRAADRLAADGQALGEVIALTNVCRIRTALGDRAGAAAQVERARRAAEASGDREALVRASVLEASYLTSLGEDLGRAHRALRRAEASAFPDGPPGLQQTVLRPFSSLSYQLGRYEEAIEKLERLLELAAAAGDRTDVASLRYNIANAKRALLEERPVDGSLE